MISIQACYILMRIFLQFVQTQTNTTEQTLNKIRKLKRWKKLPMSMPDNEKKHRFVKKNPVHLRIDNLVFDF